MGVLDEYISAQFTEFNEGDFERSLKNYIPQTKGMVGVGEALAGEGLRRAFGDGKFNRAIIDDGLRRMDEAQQAQVHKDTDSFSGAMDKGIGTVVTDWLPYQAGQLVGNLGEMGLASATGGLTGVGLAAARKVAQDQALKYAARGVLGGQVASSLKSGFGEVGGRAIDEQGLENVDMSTVVPASLGHAGLEFVGDRIMAGALKGVGDKAISVADAGFKPALVQNVARGATTAAIKEAPTEIGQTMLERGAAGLSIDNDAAVREYIDAGAAGAAMGGIPGGVGGVKDTMMSTASKENIGDKIFKAGQDKAKREFAAMDEINRMEAERQGLTPEELILQRAGLSGNVTADDLMADDQQRNDAARSLATKIVNDVASPEALRKSAAEFITRAQTDPQAHVDFTNALQSHRDAGGAMQSVNELMDAMGITLPPERRTKNNAQTPEGSAQPSNAREMAQKTAQLWMQKFGHMTEALSKLDTNNPEAVNAVEGIFNWVKKGMPSFDQVAPRLVRVLGRDAAKHVKTINDYMVAEGLTERTSDAKLTETIDKLQTLINRGVGRFDKLGNMVMPSQQDQLTTRDLKNIDKALNKFAEDRKLSANEIKQFRERMAEYFGGNVDEVLDLYDREVKEDLFNESKETERNEDGDSESVENDWNSGINETQNDVVYHGSGFDLINDEGGKKLRSKLAELGKAGFEAGAWEKLKRELSDSPDALRAQEDALIKKYGDHPSIKSQGSRLGKLRAINKRIRFAGEWVSNEKDTTDFSKRAVKDLEDKTKQGKKTDPKHQTVKDGRIVMERMVDDESNVTGTDPDTGEMTFGKKAEEFIIKTSRLVKRIRKSRDRGDINDTNDIDLANTWNQLMAGISSMMNSGEFSGRIGYRNEVNGPVTWLKAGMPSDKEIAAMAEGKKVSVKARVAETGQIVTLKDQDAAATIKDLRKDIDALEALKICMGA